MFSYHHTCLTLPEGGLTSVFEKLRSNNPIVLLDQADLDKADLRGVDWELADLYQTNLREANLSWADLTPGCKRATG